MHLLNRSRTPYTLRRRYGYNNNILYYYNLYAGPIAFRSAVGANSSANRRGGGAGPPSSPRPIEIRLRRDFPGTAAASVRGVPAPSAAPRPLQEAGLPGRRAHAPPRSASQPIECSDRPAPDRPVAAAKGDSAYATLTQAVTRVPTPPFAPTQPSVAAAHTRRLIA